MLKALCVNRRRLQLTLTLTPMLTLTLTLTLTLMLTSGPEERIFTINLLR